MTDTPETNAFMTLIDDSEIDLGMVAAKLGDMERQRDEAKESKQHTQQWYGSRWERLKHWARHEIPEELREQFFCIVANGRASFAGEEPPSLEIQLNLMRHERDRMREERDIAAENHANAISRAEAAERRIENETAEAALGWLDMLLIHCPQAVVRYNQDPDVEDALGMVPVGYSIRGDGCQGSFCVVDDSLQAVLLRDKAQAEHLAKGAYSARLPVPVLCKHCGLPAGRHGPALYEGARMECPDGLGWHRENVFSPQHPCESCGAIGRWLAHGQFDSLCPDCGGVPRGSSATGDGQDIGL